MPTSKSAFSRRALGLAALGAAALALSPNLHAQSAAGYPSRPVMIEPSWRKASWPHYACSFRQASSERTRIAA